MNPYYEESMQMQMQMFTNTANTETSSVTSEDRDNKRKDRLRAVVTRIGAEPCLQIEGVGEIRFAYRNVKKKHGDARPFIQVGDNVECRLTKSNPPKAVSVRLVKKVGMEGDQQDGPPAYAQDAYMRQNEARATSAEMARDATQPTLFTHDPYSVDPATVADKNLAAALSDSPLLCDEINAGDMDAAIEGCLSGEYPIDGLGDYYPSNQKKVSDDSFCSSGTPVKRCSSAPLSYNDEMMLMLTAFDYGY